MKSPNPRLSQYAKQIQQWRKRCAGHGECNKPVSTVRPKRLIYITNNIARLVHVHPKRKLPPYVALSYAWGEEKFYRTIPDNLSGMEGPRGQIPYDKLPQTVKDVFDMVRRLRFRYLWIDALCIVQGDRGEWKKESQKMGDTYANAALVISAVASPNANNGLFAQQHDFSKDQKREFHDIMRTCRTMTQKRWETEIKNTHPLLCRAWAFQERMLARRTVHFTPVGLVWECLESRDCGCDLIDDHKNFSSQINNMNTALKDCRDPNKHSKDRCRLVWRECVKSYTRRVLSVKDDRLHAIEGIASYIRQPESNEYENEYFNGFWKDCLPWELLWYCDQTSTLNATKARNPTFSWSSVDCGIEWPACPDGKPASGGQRSWPACQLDRITHERKAAAISTGTCFEFSLEHMKENRTLYLCKATLSNAYTIVVVARTTPVWIQETDSENKEYAIRKHGDHDEKSLSKGTHSLPFYPDIAIDDKMLQENSTFFYVEIASLTNAKEDGPLFQAGLVVRQRPAKQQTLFERIGMAGRISCAIEENGLNWSTGTEEEEITLV
jgi:hypothetical protein